MPGRYPARCPTVFGLSSLEKFSTAIARLALCKAQISYQMCLTITMLVNQVLLLGIGQWLVVSSQNEFLINNCGSYYTADQRPLPLTTNSQPQSCRRFAKRDRQFCRL